MEKDFSYPKNFLRYLGTGGARFSMMHQMRWTGGIWFQYGGLKGVIDPGPGSLFHICDAYPQLEPNDIRSILLTHRHLDHSTDINVIAEAMTCGGFVKQGSITIPEDAAKGEDPVLLKYVSSKVNKVQIMRDGCKIRLDSGVTVEPVKHIHHHVDCYGLIFSKRGLPTWGVISDTRPLDYLADRYRKCRYISINATFPDKKPALDHMSIADVGELLQQLHPDLATLTHMGGWLIKAHPDKYAAKIQTDTTRVIAAKDGMVIDLGSFKVFTPRAKRKSKTKYTTI
jgi:ribonuclease BN (tRNA processing enzyme)